MLVGGRMIGGDETGGEYDGDHTDDDECVWEGVYVRRCEREEVSVCDASQNVKVSAHVHVLSGHRESKEASLPISQAVHIPSYQATHVLNPSPI